MKTGRVQVTHPWQQSGVFASVLTVLLQICAELPPDMLDTIFHVDTSSDSLRCVGDVLFVISWIVGDALMWSGRRHVAHDADVTARSAETEVGATSQPHGLAGLRQSMTRQWERMRHPIPLR